MAKKADLERADRRAGLLVFAMAIGLVLMGWMALQKVEVTQERDALLDAQILTNRQFESCR